MVRNIQGLLVCPVTKQHLLPLDADKSKLLLDAMSDQALYHIDGTKLQVDPDSLRFLITENRHHVYSVIDDIPVLLESKQLDLSQLAVK